MRLAGATAPANCRFHRPDCELLPPNAAFSRREVRRTAFERGLLPPNASFSRQLTAPEAVVPSKRLYPAKLCPTRGAVAREYRPAHPNNLRGVDGSYILAYCGRRGVDRTLYLSSETRIGQRWQR